MPELPEVQTVLSVLETQIKDLAIEDVEIIYPKMIEMEPEQFRKSLIGEHFREFHRRGKYLIFEMDHCYLISHLRMEGKFYIQYPEEPRDRHMHVIMHLSDGHELRYHDTRKFGRMSVLPLDTDIVQFHNLGPEPFWDAFNVEYVHAYRKKKHVPLKTLLLDQSFVAGVGNIYADEILAACNLRPGRSCQRITRQDEQNLVDHTRRILTEAIAAGGTTIRSYTSSLGVTGMFQTDCTVHMQKRCKRCGGDIKMKYIGGRSSYYCPHCQK